MIDHLWQSTLFALVIAAMVPLFRRQSAGIRFWLWFAASVKFLLPLSLLVKLGGYLPALPAPAKALIAPASRTFAAPLQIAPPAPGLPVAEILIAVWALGALFVAGLWLMRWMNLRAVLRGADDLAMAPPLFAPVPVKLVASYLEPGLVGIFRPVILMPRGVAEKLSPCEMRAVLAHELSHHHRRDNLLACAQMLVEMLFWFHPLVWWIGGRLIAERERACDEAVLEHNAPRTYAEGILKICRFHLQPTLACTAGVSGGDLKMRVHAIMADQRRHELDGQRILLLGSLGLLTVMLPLLAGAPGSAPVNRLAQQVARVLTAPALPQMNFAPASVSAAAAAKPRRARPAVVPPVIAGPALPLAEAPPPLVDSTPPSQTVVVTQLRAAPPVLEDETVCRKPQKIAGSRLLGPPVCLRASTWAEMAAQGRDVGADGRSIVSSANSFEQRASINPAACIRTGGGSATTGMTSMVRLECF
jgi:beta-lactamase regulating signal transducer with metallopeptidase domain